MQETVIEVRGASRRYGDVEALGRLDLDVRSGEVLGLIGPNGGGKTTLLYLLAGLVTPSTGTVRVLGAPANETPARGRIGLLTAVPGLYPLLTGRENLRFFGRLLGLTDAGIDRRTTPLLAELEVPLAALDRPVGTWSSGMRQKLSLVRALLLDPRILLLDEPTSTLDPLSAATLFQTLRRRADGGTAVVLATHDLYAAERLCDRVAVVDRGLVEIVALPGPRHAPPPGRLHAVFPRGAP